MQCLNPILTIFFFGVLLGTLAPPAVTAATPLVFIHGIKGAELWTQGGDVHWLTAPQALGLSTPSDVALETRFDEGGAQPRGPLVAGPPLAKITLIPLVFEVDVYGKWLEAAVTLGRPFEAFAYDWRRDNQETSARFEAFLVDTAKKHGVPSVDVVAHSMGGLITLSVLKRNPTLVHRVVFAGVPFSGGIGFLPDLHVGAATGLNGGIAGRDVMATWTSVYSLFPLISGPKVVDAKGAELVFDFFDAAAWETGRAGPHAPGGRGGDAAFRAFLPQALSRAKAFRESLVAPAAGPMPLAMMVASEAYPTLHTAMKDGPASSEGWDFETVPKVPGDGRVALDTARPPAEFGNYATTMSEREHSELLSDPKVVAAIKAFLDAP